MTQNCCAWMPPPRGAFPRSDTDGPSHTHIREVWSATVILSDVSNGSDAEGLALVMELRRIALMRTFAYYTVANDTGATVIEAWAVASPAKPPQPVPTTDTFGQSVGVDVQFTFVEGI